MDFSKLARSLKDVSHSPNSTGATLAGAGTSLDLPSKILESLIPGYSVLSKFLLDSYGFDVSIIVTVAVIALAASKAIEYLYERATKLFHRWCVSSVYIDEEDDLFDSMMGWVAEKHRTTVSRKVRVKTGKGSRINEDENVSAELYETNGMFDYIKWSASTSPRFEPYYGSRTLWHNGHMVIFSCSQKSRPAGQMHVQFGGPSSEDILQLDCIGGTTKPIQDLIQTVRGWSLDRQRGYTTIRHPMTKEKARYSGAWARTYPRPSRPMDTVVLDSVQKDSVIKDMNEYLHPSSERWYAARGIPYRRGYLFSGPPGTGKTSLSFALAGLFGLDIYVISLQEPTLTESDLLQLFNGLPRRCIVLLEDVDAAGLRRDHNSGQQEASKSKRNGEKEAETEEGQRSDQSESYTLRDLAQELRSIAKTDRGGANEKGRRQQNTQQGTATGISLSGLLNAIDGVATAEGRVLIMTTNHAEQLDAALTRPGRVDRRINFARATREQMAELFMRMYTDLGPGRHTPPAGSKTIVNEASRLSSEPDFEQLARRFADQVPDDTFTPAEVQSLLMQHKREPREAVAQAGAWVRQTLDERKAREAEAVNAVTVIEV